MKDRIINIAVVLGMVIFANYPMYKNLKATAGEIDLILQTVQAEIIAWQRDVNIVQDRIEDIRYELVGTINKGLAQTDSVLIKIKALETEAKMLGNKIDGLKTETVNKVKQAIEPKKINNKIDSLKIDTKDRIKKMMDFKKMMKIKG